MASRPQSSDPVWARDAGAKPKLTREAIVRAAIEIADADGLAAVSIRSVAARLQARPMSLYSHVEKKADLLDLMLDEVAAEALLDEVPDDWRAALRAIAASTRAGGLRHPWVVEAMGQLTAIGPNGIRHVDQSLAAIAGLGLEPADARAILRAVDTYTLGQLAFQLANVPLDDSWSSGAAQYLDAMAADLPHLRRFGVERAFAAEDHDETFRRGLDWLLDGFAAALGR